MHRHKTIFHALVLVIGFTLASVFGVSPSPDPGDSSTPVVKAYPWYIPVLDLFWWVRRY
jgi:hypothetical protein